MKGNIPAVSVFFFWNLFVHQLCVAQLDTVMLNTVDVSQVIEKQYKEFASFEFDSSQYSSNALDAGEFLTSQSSMYIKDYGPGSTSSLSYRGNSAYHTKVYWEGISIDNVMLGQSDLSLVSLSNDTRAAFLKGGHSIGMASGGFGGVLNLETGKDDWKGISVGAGVEYGSFNARRIPVSLFLGNGKWKFEAFLNTASSDNNYPYIDYQNKDVIAFRENAAFERIQFIPKLSFKANKHHSFSFSYWYTLSERQVPSAIGTNNGKAFQTDLWNKSLFSYQYIKNKWQVELKSNYSKDHLNYSNEALLLESLSQIDAFRNMLMATNLISPRMKLESQLRYDFVTVRSSNFEALEDQRIFSFFQSINHHRKDYYIKPAVRIEHQSARNTYLLPSLDIGISPFDFKRPLWLYASYTRNVRFPSFNEQFWLNSGNPDLKEEVANSAEVGFDQVLIKRKNTQLSFQSTAFYSEVLNLIVWSPTSNTIWIPQNLKSVTNAGLEIEGKYHTKIKDWRIEAKAAYTYVSSEVSEDELVPENEGNQQLYVPKHKAFGNLTLSFRSYFLAYNQSYTDEVFTTNDNTEKLPFNSPVNTELGKRFQMNDVQVTLSFSVKNLFDESYQYVLHQPMPMRHFFVSLNFNFNNTTNSL